MIDSRCDPEPAVVPPTAGDRLADDHERLGGPESGGGPGRLVAWLVGDVLRRKTVAARGTGDSASLSLSGDATVFRGD